MCVCSYSFGLRGGSRDRDGGRAKIEKVSECVCKFVHACGGGGLSSKLPKVMALGSF